MFTQLTTKTLTNNKTMEEKLTIKHLAPYLPYGLKAENTDSSNEEGKEWMGIKTIIGMHDETVMQSLNNFPYIIRFHVSKIKPILRPLSDLTKEIEVNGERFVPIIHLKKLFNLRMYQFMDNKIYSLNYGVFIDYTQLPYNVIQKLIEWHFNVFNLPENLYVDINTLKQ